MRITFLNTWHGEIWDNLRNFVIDQSKKTDIFCFSEVDPALKTKLEFLLKQHTSIYELGIKTNYFEGIHEGRCIFTKKEITIKSTSSRSIFSVTKDDAGGFQYAELGIDAKTIFIGNVHGKARPGDKLDTEPRIEQSRRIIEFFDGRAGIKVIGGDFNLMPEAESIKMFERKGYRNLVKNFKIKNTRNRLSWERFAIKQYFSDYIFISPEVKVVDFSVPNIEISDHLPLILDFEV